MSLCFLADMYRPTPNARESHFDEEAKIKKTKLELQQMELNS
jgi:hypothetical protein